VRFAESFTQAALFLCVRRRGPYHNAGKALEDVCKFAEAHGLTTKSTKCAGLYFDDPKTVKAEELQWMAGLLVHRNEEQKCLAISQKDLAEHDMIIRVMPQTKVVETVFPIKLVPVSFMLCAMKVYAAFCKQDKYKLQSGSYEVYDMDAREIRVCFPQENFGSFCP